MDIKKKLKMAKAFQTSPNPQEHVFGGAGSIGIQAQYENNLQGGNVHGDRLLQSGLSSKMRKMKNTMVRTKVAYK